MVAWIKHLVPPGYQADFEILKDEINTIWGAFYHGHLLLSLVVATILTVESLVIGLRFPLLMGILGGLMEFMPGLGPGIWLLIASILALFDGSA